MYQISSKNWTKSTHMIVYTKTFGIKAKIHHHSKCNVCWLTFRSELVPSYANPMLHRIEQTSYLLWMWKYGGQICLPNPIPSLSFLLCAYQLAPFRRAISSSCTCNFMHQQRHVSITINQSMPYDGFTTANGTNTINNPFLHQDKISRENSKLDSD